MLVLARVDRSLARARSSPKPDEHSDSGAIAVAAARPSDPIETARQAEKTARAAERGLDSAATFLGGAAALSPWMGASPAARSGPVGATGLVLTALSLLAAALSSRAKSQADEQENRVRALETAAPPPPVPPAPAPPPRSPSLDREGPRAGRGGRDVIWGVDYDPRPGRGRGGDASSMC